MKGILLAFLVIVAVLFVTVESRKGRRPGKGPKPGIGRPKKQGTSKLKAAFLSVTDNNVMCKRFAILLIHNFNLINSHKTKRDLTLY